MKNPETLTTNFRFQVTTNNVSNEYYSWSIISEFRGHTDRIFLVITKWPKEM